MLRCGLVCGEDDCEVFDCILWGHGGGTILEDAISELLEHCGCAALGVGEVDCAADGGVLVGDLFAVGFEGDGALCAVDGYEVCAVGGECGAGEVD